MLTASVIKGLKKRELFTELSTYWVPCSNFFFSALIVMKSFLRQQQLEMLIQELQMTGIRSSHSQMFFKIGLSSKNPQIRFLIKLKAFRHATFLQRDFNTGIFL